MMGSTGFINTAWVKSSYSGGDGNCVQTAVVDDTVYISDSKYLRDPANDPAQLPVIAVPAAEWPRFLASATDHSANASAIQIAVAPDQSVTLRAADISLSYTSAEWEAFLAGIQDGQFDLPQLVAA